MNRIWQTSQREIPILRKTIVMGILNVTPDSFSDGGDYKSLDQVVKRAGELIDEGADIIDVGGESTRPNSKRVPADNEIKRVVPAIEAIRKHFDVPVSVDTSKGEVATRAIDVGAEIINDISGLRFDEKIGEVAAESNAGLVLMHLRGEFETMHSKEPAKNIFKDVSARFDNGIKKAIKFGVSKKQICLDVGIGFSKTFNQNLELIAKLDKLMSRFSGHPILVGTSRKSFIGKILGDVSPSERLNGSLASNVIAAWNGADIVRVHDVKETVQAIRVCEAIRNEL